MKNANYKNLTKYKEMTINHFREMPANHKRIWLEVVNQNVEDAQLVKEWVEGAIRNADK